MKRALIKSTLALIVMTTSFWAAAGSPQAADEATIVVYRADESFKTQRVNLDVHVDTASLGRLDAQDVLLASGKPGTYTLATSLPGDVSLQLELQPGSTHYVHTRLQIGRAHV